MPSEEELLTRQMPHSTEAEQSVLGSMLIDARCVPEVIEALRPEDFYLRTNREIYETIYSMFNFSLTIDPVTVLEHMKQNGVYDENTSRNYVLQLMEITPTAANVKEYVAIVKDKALLRRIAETAGELTAMVQEGTGTAQEVLEHFQLARYFERVCGASLDAGRETKEDVISYLLAQIGDPGQVVMVGDTAFDVLGAKVHGIPTIGVTWGYGQVEAMREAGAAALADTPEQLEALLHTPGIFSPAPPQALP